MSLLCDISRDCCLGNITGLLSMFMLVNSGNYGWSLPCDSHNYAIAVALSIYTRMCLLQMFEQKLLITKNKAIISR